MKLLERDAEWAALASDGGDVDSIVSYWTDDAVMLPPDLPAVMGKPALREYVQASSQLSGFSITWRSTEVALSPDGNLAYMFGENAVTMDGPNGTPTTIPGRGVTSWRREPDGKLRCAVDIWNAGPT